MKRIEGRRHQRSRSAALAHRRRRPEDQSSSSGRRLASNSAAGVLAQGVSLAVVLALTPIQLSGMGREGYALVALAAATSSYITLFDVGGGWPVMRFVPLYRSQHRERDADEAFSVALIASLVVGVVGAGVLWVIAPAVATTFHTTPNFHNQAIATLRVSGLCLIPLLLIGVLSGAGRAIGMFRTWASISAGSVIVFNVLWLWVAKSSRNPDDVMVAQLLVSVVSTLIWSIILVQSLRSPALRLPRNWKLGWQLIRFSTMSSVGQLGLLLLMSIGTIVVSSVVGAAQLAYYSIPSSFAQRLTIVASAVAVVAFPSLSQKRGVGAESDQSSIIWKSHALVTASTLSLSSIVLWAGPSAMSIWISPSFSRQASGPLVALVIGFCLISLSSIYHINMEAVGRIGLTTILTIVSGVIGIIACAILARRWGETGGAAGIAIGLGLLAICIVGASIYHEGVPSWSQVQWTITSAVVLFGIGAGAHTLLSRWFPSGYSSDIANVVFIVVAVGIAGGYMMYRAFRRKVDVVIGEGSTQ
jgi:O-antigen/teichoic acid export membrane protein